MGGVTYMRTNRLNTVIYTGVTGDKEKRDAQHRGGIGSGFAAKYLATKLVWHEEYADIRDAIAREKQIKAGSRAKKEALINVMNPHWIDLGKDWGK